MSYTPYKAKMRVYGQIPAIDTDNNLYVDPVAGPNNNPKIYSAGYPSLAKKFNSDPVLSEDCTDDYAEPRLSIGRW